MKNIYQVIYIVGLVITFVLGYTYQSDIYLVYKVSNGCFVSAFYTLTIALVRHVKSVGLFKTLAYAKYKREKSKDGNSKADEMHEFAEKRYGYPVSNGMYYLVAALLFSVSIVSTFIV